jgi:hypothetical protein
MTDDQQTVIDWLSNSEYDFMSNLVELEGAYESVPDDVVEAFAALSDAEQIEAIKEAAANLLAK